MLWNPKNALEQYKYLKTLKLWKCIGTLYICWNEKAVKNTHAMDVLVILGKETIQILQIYRTSNDTVLILQFCMEKNKSSIHCFAIYKGGKEPYKVKWYNFINFTLSPQINGKP
jgi:hypothetical protein